jgi:transcriptional regulator of NAD metabolism
MSEADQPAERPLDIRDGVIHYGIYGQDGSMIPMKVKDSPDMQRFVRWVRRHDRYTLPGESL